MVSIWIIFVIYISLLVCFCLTHLPDFFSRHFASSLLCICIGDSVLYMKIKQSHIIINKTFVVCYCLLVIVLSLRYALNCTQKHVLSLHAVSNNIYETIFIVWNIRWIQTHTVKLYMVCWTDELRTSKV